jgi:hypothetical protein
MLEVQHDRAWHDFVTLAAVRFHLNMDYEFIWLPYDEKNRKRGWHTTQSKEFMPEIV